MRLKLLFSTILVFIPTIQAVCKKCGEEEDIILNCYGKRFRCINETNYYHCSDFGPVSLAFSSQTIQVCPIGMICSSANKYQCVAPSESSTTTECPPEESDVTTTLGSVSTRGVNYTTEITFTVSTQTTPDKEDTSESSTESSSSSTPSGSSKGTTEGTSSNVTPSKPSESSTEPTGGVTGTGTTEQDTTTKLGTESTPSGTPPGNQSESTPNEGSSSSPTTPESTESSSTDIPSISTETTIKGSSDSTNRTTPTATTEGSTEFSGSTGNPTERSSSTITLPSVVTEESSTSTIQNSTEPFISTETTTGDTSSTTPSPIIFTCPGVGKYPDTTDCSKYHLCVNISGVYYDLEGTCPSETRFDPYNLICTTSPVQCPGERTLNCTNETISAHPDKCNRYYSCSWNYILNKYDLKQYLCAVNEKYDEQSKSCVTSTDCHPDNSDEFTCRDVGSYPVDYNCSDFYYCELTSNNTLTKTVKSCGDTALFDRAKKKCRKACLVTNCPFNNVDIE